MTEVVDGLVDMVEQRLSKKKTELTTKELDEIREMPDAILDNHEE